MTVLTEIPLEFESYLRDKTLQKLPTNLNEFIFAYIPNLDLSVDIDRNSTIPNENLIVHRAPVANIGKTGENAIVYSAIIDSTVPEFTFNAIYLHDKEANICGMIIHQQDETKQQAMTITKSALMQYDSAAASANVTVDAETWQVDINDKFNQYTLKKDFLRHYAGSGCVDEHTLSETPNSNTGALIFSDSESALTLNHATYIMSDMIVEVQTQSVTLEVLVGDVSRKDFVYVTSNGDFLLYKGTDDSSDPKVVFSKLGFAPVSGDPLLYKKGEVFALAIGFIQRVGDTYFSSKLPPAAPKFEPKLIDCWFDLRLSAHKQDVNLLREKAIRAAVAGELRGKSKAPYLRAVLRLSPETVYNGNVSFGQTGLSVPTASKINSVTASSASVDNWYIVDTNGVIVPILYIWTSNSLDSEGVVRVSDYHCSLEYISKLDVKNAFLVVEAGLTLLSEHACDVVLTDYAGNSVDITETTTSKYRLQTAEFDTVPCVDIVGTPEMIAKTFPSGVFGKWIPQLLDNNLKVYFFNNKALGTPNRTYTTDCGETWVTGISPIFDSVTNSTGEWLADNKFVYLFQYETLSKFTQLANNSNVICDVGDVSASIWRENNYGARLAYSTIDRILKNSNINAGVYDILSKTRHHIFNNALVPSGSWGRTSDITHSPLAFGKPTPANIFGVKLLSTITERSGLLFLQLHGIELVHAGSGWGDDSIVPIINGEGTKTDKNGNTVKTFCHHSIFPIGIADSQTLASLNIDNRANISDDINSGLHFDCLDDVPEPIRDFYYEIEDDLGLIRVYKHHHPHENGGHISDENIASWQFHDDFKDWLQICAEIKFNASQSGEESERVPLPPMPIKSDYFGE